MFALRVLGWVAAVDLVLATVAVRAEPLVLCGMAEVFLVDSSAVAAGNIEKQWSWRARDCESLPEPIRGRFGTTDECKPTADGNHILIASSGGGCALVERATGRALWYAVVPNAHSLESLPHARIVVAASIHKEGNRLMVFDLERPDVLVAEAPLPSAHGVVWDADRNRLWALGYDELHCYELRDWKSSQPALGLETKFKLPDVGGHDLQAVPGGDDLVVTTHGGVHLFDRRTTEFRPHPQLAEATNVKSVQVHPRTGQTVYIRSGGDAWWSRYLGFLSPDETRTLPDERLYKARWLP